MPESDLDLLKRAALDAGKIALKHFHEGQEVWDKPGGLGPVGEADLAVDAMLGEELRAARPDYGWLSEETEDDHARLVAERVFIVDPIDGTRSFVEGSGTWAHSLAVSENGRITAAVVYLPARDKMYAASLGGGATLNDAPIRASSRTSLSGASALVARPMMRPEHWRGGEVPALERSFRPSLAYRLALVAEGRYDAMLSLRPTWEWDIAAGALLLEEAGALSSDRRGRTLRFNNPGQQTAGVVGGAPKVHKALTQALA